MKTETIIRSACAGDSDAVYRLLRIIADVHKTGRPDIFEGLVSKYTHEEVKSRLSCCESGVFVAETNGDVSGYIFCEIRNEGKGKTLYIDDLCVDPEFRRCGIATALMNHARKYAKENECRMLMLNVWEFNESALDFYESIGFTTRSRHLELNI
jgi:ribosomal protein S18 acetylase RimI-like enzyme